MKSSWGKTRSFAWHVLGQSDCTMDLSWCITNVSKHYKYVWNVHTCMHIDSHECLCLHVCMHINIGMKAICVYIDTRTFMHPHSNSLVCTTHSFMCIFNVINCTNNSIRACIYCLAAVLAHIIMCVLIGTEVTHASRSLVYANTANSHVFTCEIFKLWYHNLFSAMSHVHTNTCLNIMAQDICFSWHTYTHASTTTRAIMSKFNLLCSPILKLSRRSFTCTHDTSACIHDNMYT
jgi:hypothetical protein